MASGIPASLSSFAAKEDRHPSVLQRLLIVHQQLPDLYGLDEGASEEELSEHILYYHDDEDEDGITDAGSGHRSQKAIQFAGICAALRSLAGTFHKAEDDFTNEVHFSGATLVFVPLEANENPHIYAVAQVGSMNHQAPSSGQRKHNCCPLAVRSAIQRCHKLFCLLRGGIHYRLSCSGELNEPRIRNGLSSEGVYPGMELLYDLRRKSQRAKTKLKRLSHSSSRSDCSDLQTNIGVIENEIQNLLEELPILSLRNDLKNHYDDFLVDRGLIAASTGLSFRSIVDNVPTPIVQPSETLQRNHVPTPLDDETAAMLDQTLRALLGRYAEFQENNIPPILGISCFFGGRHVQTVMTPNLKDTETDDPGSQWNVIATTEIAHLLMEYFSSYQRKVFHHSKPHNFIQESTQARFERSFRHTTSGGRFDEMSERQIESADSISKGDQSKPRGEFFQSPPLSMLNTSDDILDVHLPSYGCVWTPEVYLPVSSVEINDGKRTTTTRVRANVVLYEQEGFSNLLYLRSEWAPVEQNEKRVSSLGEILESLATDLADCFRGIDQNHNIPPVDDMINVEPGQDIILINRQDRSLVFVSSREGDKKKDSQQRGFFSKKVKLKPTLDTSLGLDCRHALASSLPADVLHAFDDLMSEVDKIRYYSAAQAEEAFETCTYRRHGWIYASVQRDRELYALFDPRAFVTISDVHQAIWHLRETFLVGSIETNKANSSRNSKKCY